MFCTRFTCQIEIKLDFLDIFSKNIQQTNLIEIRPVGAELFHADGRTDGQSTTNIRISQFCERA